MLYDKPSERLLVTVPLMASQNVSFTINVDPGHSNANVSVVKNTLVTDANVSVVKNKLISIMFN